MYGNAADHHERVRRYPSDMTDAEWAEVRPSLPVPVWLQGWGGWPEGYCHRQLLDAVRYLVAGGISWREVSADFPDWGGVYAFFRRWREYGLIAELHDWLRGEVREREGREAEPTAAVIDAQSVRAAATVPASSRGYDGGKKVPGRKRHIVTDTLGLLLVVAVTAANIGDRDAAADLQRRLRRLHRETSPSSGQTAAGGVLRPRAEQAGEETPSGPAVATAARRGLERKNRLLRAPWPTAAQEAPAEATPSTERAGRSSAPTPECP
ncbi:transposase [Streptomyces massasporeus]|uniref:transposase n=1 Tax=Streptomyces massasporeus TaxID=67324 RepID=UPI0033A2A56A